MLAASNHAGLPRQKLPHIYELICFKINIARGKKRESGNIRAGKELKGFGVKKGFTYKLK